MKRRRRIEIELETERIIITRRRHAPPLCPVCAPPVALATVNEVAATTGLGSRAIFRLIEATGIHFLEHADGSVWVCLDSLHGVLEPIADD